MVCGRVLPWVRRAIGDGTHAGEGGIEGNSVAKRKTAGTGPAADGHSKGSQYVSVWFRCLTLPSDVALGSK